MSLRTRTIKLRGSRTLLGKLPVFLTILLFFFIGLYRQITGLTVFAGILILLTSTAWLVRRRTVVSLDDKGIRYSSPFWKLHFQWHEVKATGVYYVVKGHVYEDTALPDPGRSYRTIFVSTQPSYSPCRHHRLISRTNMHFRWNREAWDIITSYTQTSAS